MNLATKLLVGAGATAGLWAGATALSGNQVEQALKAQAEHWRGSPDGLIRITDVQYDKQFRHATRTLTLELGCAAQGGEPLRLTWQDRIEHGPFPGARFGAARITSELVLDAPTQAALAKIKRGDDPLQLTTTVGWTGSTDTEFKLPALALQEGEQTLEFKGLQARLQLDRNGNARYSGELPGYTLRGAQGVTVALQGARFEGEAFGPHWWAASGKGSGSLQSLSLAGPGPDGAPRTLFALQKLDYRQDGRIQEGLYSAEAQMSGQGEIASVPMEAVKLRASFKRIHLDSYAQLVSTAMTDGCAAQPDPKAKLNQLGPLLAKMLPFNPEFSLDEFSATLKGHKASLRYRVGTQGVTADEVKAGLGPAQLKKLSAQVAFDVPLPLIQQVLAAQGQAVPPEAVAAQADTAVARGFLRRQGDVLSLDLELKNGAATLNGKPLPIPGLTPPPLPHGDPH